MLCPYDDVIGLSFGIAVGHAGITNGVAVHPNGHVGIIRNYAMVAILPDMEYVYEFEGGEEGDKRFLTVAAHHYSNLQLVKRCAAPDIEVGCLRRSDGSFAFTKIHRHCNYS